MASLFAHYSQNACHLHRLVYPARFLKQDFPGHRILASANDPPGDFDCYCLHGIQPLQAYPSIGAWLDRGGRFVWSTDDDWVSVPDWNPAKLAKDQMWAYRLARRTADSVLVSTEALASTFPEKHVVTAPNLLDLSRDTYPHDRPAADDGGPIRVLWTGSITHSKDTAVAEKGIDAVLRDLGPKRVQFIFLGQGPPGDLLADHLMRGVTHHPQVPLEQYWGTVAQIRPHVVLAPLDDCFFNTAKSNLRILEAWASTAATIASPVGEYRVIRNEDDGLFATTPDDWADAIWRCVTNAELRHRLATAGRRRVEKEGNWHSYECRAPWRKAVAELLRIPEPTPLPRAEAAEAADVAAAAA